MKELFMIIGTTLVGVVLGVLLAGYLTTIIWEGHDR